VRRGRKRSPETLNRRHRHASVYEGERLHKAGALNEGFGLQQFRVCRVQQAFQHKLAFDHLA
jgi:hypothetical protein